MTPELRLNKERNYAPLLALLESYVDFQFFAVAQNGDWHDVPNLAAAQGVGEIVKIVDGLVAKSDENVTSFKAGLGSR